jgi:hypothetical protein
MKKIISVISLVFISSISFAQWQQSKIDFSLPNESVAVKQNDPTLLQNLPKNSTLLNYTDIEGTAFWKEDWQKGYMYTRAGNIILLEKAKMNLYSGELHYISAAGTELVVETSAVSKVVLMQKKDSTKIDAVFAVLANYVDSKPVAFFRVFNTGIYQLVLLEQKKVKTTAYDPLQSKSNSSFYSNYNYALYNNGVILPLKKLDRNTILPIIKSHQEDEDWLNNKHNKMKTVTEVTSFLDYFNTKQN